MIAKIADVEALVSRGRADPESAFAEVRRLAASEEWQTREREVAATTLVEIGKKHPEAVAANALKWAKSDEPFLRRAASEGLRGIVKVRPELVWPVLEKLRADDDLYVRKSVANILRNASGKHADAVLATCRRWAALRDPNTQWIIRDGLRKLKISRAAEAAAILGAPKRDGG
jgi:3-methyladenine DNA glycosylase AlkC